MRSIWKTTSPEIRAMLAALGLGLVLIALSLGLNWSGQTTLIVGGIGAFFFGMVAAPLALSRRNDKPDVPAVPPSYVTFSQERATPDVTVTLGVTTGHSNGGSN